MRLSHKFNFSSAHFLPYYEGACRNLHGHDWKCKLEISGLYDNKTGMICDFKIIKQIVNDCIISKLDHKLLNDIFENPTAENIVVWIFENLYDELEKYQLAIAKIELWESENSSVIFDPVEEIMLREEYEDEV